MSAPAVFPPVATSEGSSLGRAVRRSGPLLRRVLIALGLSVVAAWAVHEGVALRQWTFAQTKPIRFGDIQRGYRFGYRATQEGYFDLYDKVLAEDVLRQKAVASYTPEFDYAPLRLAVMRWWATQVLARNPDARSWEPDYAFTEPALRLNMGLELAAAVAVFLLVQHWMRRSAPAPASGGTARVPAPEPGARGLLRLWLLPLLGALLLWFNPAMILNVHGWTGWDMWIIPFYLWGLYLACTRWWFVSGLMIGLGSLLKGQQWIVAPFFVLWPVFQARFGAALRWVLGAALGVALVVSPWMLRTPLDPARVEATVKAESPVRIRWGVPPMSAQEIAARKVPPLRDPAADVLNRPALWWAAALVLGVAAVGARRLFPKLRWQWWVAPAALAAALILWRWHACFPATGDDPVAGWLRWQPALWGVLIAAVFLGLAWALPLKLQGYLLAAAAVAGLLLAIPLFNASTGWYTVGWKYGTHHWPWMIMGRTDNIPGLLTARFGWDNTRDLMKTAFTVDPRGLGLPLVPAFDVTWKTLFGSIYGLTLVLCAWGASRHDRAHDRRFLVAAVAPWVLMFTILGQIHERYLLFAAGIGACLVGVSVGFVLLDLLFTAATWIMTINIMLLVVGRTSAHNWPRDPGLLLTHDGARKLLAWVQATHPDLAWAIAVAAVIFLYVALSPPRRPAGVAPGLPPL